MLLLLVPLMARVLSRSQSRQGDFPSLRNTIGEIGEWAAMNYLAVNDLAMDTLSFDGSLDEEVMTPSRLEGLNREYVALPPHHAS